jgi:hypothetical protein
MRTKIVEIYYITDELRKKFDKVPGQTERKAHPQELCGTF